MGSVSLTEFLLARIADDEEIATAAEHADGPDTLSWSVAGGRRLSFTNGRGENYMAVRTGTWERILIARDEILGGHLARHIATHDPVRVLAECEAKRRIVEIHWVNTEDDAGQHDCPGDWVNGVDDKGEPCPTLRLLALPYADHPDYDPSWRPVQIDEIEVGVNRAL